MLSEEFAGTGPTSWVANEPVPVGGERVGLAEHVDEKRKMDVNVVDPFRDQRKGCCVVGGNCAAGIMTAQLQLLSGRQSGQLGPKHFTSFTKQLRIPPTHSSTENSKIIRLRK